MKIILYKILSILDTRSKKKFIFISIFLLFVTLIEVLSIGTLYQLSKALLEIDYFQKVSSYKIISYFEDNLNFEIDLDIMIYFLISLFIIKFFISFVYHYLQSSFVEGIRKKLTSKMTNVYLNKNFKFFLSRNSSVFVRNITSEIGSFSLGVINNLLILITETFILFSILTLLVLSDYKLVFIICVTTLTISLLFFYFTKSISKKFSLQKLRFSNYFIKSVLYLFQSIKNIKIYNSENFHKHKVNENLYKVSQAQIFLSVSSQAPKILMETTIVLLIGLFILTLNIEKLDINLITKITLFVVAFFRIIPSTSKIISSINQIRFNIPSINVIYKDTREIFKNKKNKKTNVINFNKIIEGENISFKYSESQNYLFKNLNFKFKSGKLIGILGESGIGKSTFFDILIGLLIPTKGRICIDRKKIINWEDAIHNFSYATQETSIFNDTIRNNVINGNEELLKKKISDIQIEDILNKCGLEKFYKNTRRGVNSIITENGKNMSIGQRQRIGIARCLFKNSKIWLLDEITSSLDAKNAQMILKNIKKISPESLKIIISHDLSNFKICDEVYKISNKRLIKVKI